MVVFPGIGVNVTPLELSVLTQILRRAGYVVLTMEDQVDIESTLAKMLDVLNSIAAAVNALPNGNTLNDAIAQINTTLSGLTAGQTLEQTDLTALQTAVNNVQTTLGPVPQG